MKKISGYISVLALLAACNNEPKSNGDSNARPESIDAALPAAIPYQIVNSYAHDTKAFTEGLQFVDGRLLESTGNYGSSDLRFTELNTGKVLKKTPLDAKYFGEGCTQIKDKIYQLTYRENTCLVYDAATLKKTGEFTYNIGEGWGMTTDGTHLIVSNGGSNLFFFDPLTFREMKRVGVYNQYGPVSNINELEYIKGFIYANIWQQDVIIKIDPVTGKIVGVADLSDIRPKLGIPPAIDDSSPEVLNGIAYDSAANRIFITGKNWPKLLEVKLDN